MLLLSRRHRAFTLALALMMAGVFLVFITRGHLTDAPKVEPRQCGLSSIYAKGEDYLSFEETQRLYHWTMEQLVEERMRLYEGTILLRCSGEHMADVIPPGALASNIAKYLPSVPNPPRLTYADFDLLLLEFWRTYDCHLKTPFAFSAPSDGDDENDVVGHFESFKSGIVERESVHARRTFDRLLSVLRSSEQYLPLHASLRCLQRGATDVRNAVSLLSDAGQCLPQRLGQPSTSILK